MKKLLSDISKLKVAVIGDVILDHFAWGRVNRISPEAPVPVVDIEKEAWFAGGAANVAMDAAALKANVSLYGSSAADASGETLSEILLNAQIYYERFDTSEGAPTSVKTRITAKGQQLIRLDRSGASPKQYAPTLGYIKNMLEAVAKSDAVIISDYARGFLNQDLVHSIIETARAAKKFIAVDPKPRRKLCFSGPNLMTANREEAFVLAEMVEENESELPIKELAKNIYDRYGADYLVITLGAQGMYACKKSKPLKHVPTAARAVFDTSGAGDAVVASLSLALAAGVEIEKAVEFANIAAGIVVGKMGSTTVSAEELLKYKT